MSDEYTPKCLIKGHIPKKTIHLLLAIHLVSESTCMSKLCFVLYHMDYYSTVAYPTCSQLGRFTTNIIFYVNSSPKYFSVINYIQRTL